MKTAMEWYFEEEEKFRRGQTKHFSVGPIQKQALEKEKEQIINAINSWCSDDNLLTPEQYYEETYNK